MRKRSSLSPSCCFSRQPPGRKQPCLQGTSRTSCETSSHQRRASGIRGGPAKLVKRTLWRMSCSTRPCGCPSKGYCGKRPLGRRRGPGTTPCTQVREARPKGWLVRRLRGVRVVVFALGVLAALNHDRTARTQAQTHTRSQSGGAAAARFVVLSLARFTSQRSGFHDGKSGSTAPVVGEATLFRPQRPHLENPQVSRPKILAKPENNRRREEVLQLDGSCRFPVNASTKIS